MNNNGKSSVNASELNRYEVVEAIYRGLASGETGDVLRFSNLL
jgi:hypothetical protein